MRFQFKTQTILLFASILLGFSSCKKNDTVNFSNSTIIWQGFHHVWDYNHRVNRMGDWVTDFDNVALTANIYHSAASGIGPDENIYTSYYSTLQTNAAIYFKEISTTLILTGEEETVDSQTVNLILDFPLLSNPNAVVLLNGFDMFARPIGSENLVGDGDSDKLFNFSVQPKNIITTTIGDKTQISFDVATTLGGSCASPECSNNDFFDYEVNLFFQVMTSDDASIKKTNEDLEISYSWERPMNNGNNEIFQEDKSLLNNNITGQAGWETGFIGIESFTFESQKGFSGFTGQSFEYPHLHTFNMALRNTNYTAESGNISYDADLFFKNWSKPIPFFSFGGGGSVEFEMKTALVQIDAPSTINTNTIEGEIIWFTNPFEPSPPNTPASFDINPIMLP